VTSVVQALGSVGEQLSSLDPRWVALALAFQVANVGFRALAWRAVVAAAYPREEVRLRDCAAAYAAGVALNAYVPARGGEALKIALLRLRVPGSAVTTLAASSTVILLFDAVMGVLLVSIAWSLGVLPGLPQPSLTAVLGVVAGAAALALLVSFLPRLRAHLRQGTAILRTPGVYVRRVVPAQLAAWVCRVAVSFTLLAAFGLPATLPLAALVVVAGGLSTLVPATPGGAGTQQVLVVFALQQAATAASALAFSIGLQVGVTLVNTLLGLLGLALLLGTLRPSTVRATLGSRTR
jgi:uncharacterized membrane protein YbhN (UPF0104 family)